MRKFTFFCFQTQSVLGLTNYYVPLKKGKGLKKCKDCKKEHCNVKIIFLLLQIIELSDYDSPATRKPRFLIEPRTVRKKREKVEWILRRGTPGIKWECASVDSGIRILQSAPEDLWQVTRGTLEPASEVFRRQWNYFQTVKLWDSFERACAEEKSARDSSRSSCR